MANGIGSLLERYGNPQTKAELAGSVLAGVSPAGGLLDAITSMLALKEGEYGKAALYALGAGLPFVSGSPLHKLGKQILGKRSRNRPGYVKPEVTDREVSQLRALNASDGQILQLNRQIKAQRKQSTMSRRASAKTRPPAERTFNRSGTTPRVGGGQGWLDVGKKETAEAIDPGKAIARRLQKEQDEALLSLDDQFRLSGPDQKLVLDKNWAHLWAPESIPSQVNLLRLVEEGKLTQEQYLLIKRIVEARKRNPRAKSPLTHEQMRSLGNPVTKAPSPGPSLPDPYRTKFERDPYFGGTPEEATQILLDKGYDMTGYYGSALMDDVGKGIMGLPVTKTNLGRGSVVTTDPNLAIRYAQRGPGEGIITPLRFKSEYALPMESGPNTPLSRYFLDQDYPEDYILNKPLSLEEFIASIS